MRILSPALKGLIKLRWSSIDNFLLNPESTQTMLFNNLVHSGQFTEFGKKYDFQHIDSVREFKKNVPVNEYEDLKPYIHQQQDRYQVSC